MNNKIAPLPHKGGKQAQSDEVIILLGHKCLQKYSVLNSISEGIDYGCSARFDRESDS